CDHSSETRADAQTRITVVGLTGAGAGRYRHVWLTRPTLRKGRSVDADVGIHAGGAALAGKWLYLADSDALDVFNLDYVLREPGGRYTLPEVERYAVVGGRDIFSSISIDGSGGGPVLVGAAYDATTVADAPV